MISRKTMKNSILILAMSSISASGFCQIMFNNGATIWSGTQSTIQINGGLENNGATGLIDHNGDMTVTLNSTFPNPGDVILSNGSTMQGNGTYHVEQDWVNNATFTAGTSTVELFGNLQQMITGSNVTTFHNLSLTGTGTGNNRKKSQTIDARIDASGILDLNDRELDTDVNDMIVLNPAPAAVQNDQTFGNEGFVSSIAPGVLSRETNSTSDYLFPTGSSINSTRYRAVDITPTDANTNTFTVRFINHNSDLDGFTRSVNDGSIINANDTFYHAILRPVGGTPADITIWYLPSADGSWTGMAHWRDNNATSNPNMWNNMKNAVPVTGSNYSALQRNGWLFANPGFPYILMEINDSILIPNVFTPNGDGINDEFYIANNGMKEYHIEIYNRWGTKIFEADASEIRWDGRTTTGVQLSDGTYYYILKAITWSDKDFSQTGYVTLLKGGGN
jgi:gliding motility-associated-like protein